MGDVRLLSLRELARELGCRYETARGLVDRGEIKSKIVGNRRRVAMQAVHDWLNRDEKRRRAA